MSRSDKTDRVHDLRAMIREEVAAALEKLMPRTVTFERPMQCSALSWVEFKTPVPAAHIQPFCAEGGIIQEIDRSKVDQNVIRIKFSEITRVTGMVVYPRAVEE